MRKMLSTIAAIALLAVSANAQTIRVDLWDSGLAPYYPMPIEIDGNLKTQEFLLRTTFGEIFLINPNKLIWNAYPCMEFVRASDEGQKFLHENNPGFAPYREVHQLNGKFLLTVKDTDYRDSKAPFIMEPLEFHNCK